MISSTTIRNKEFLNRSISAINRTRTGTTTLVLCGPMNQGSKLEPHNQTQFIVMLRIIPFYVGGGLTLCNGYSQGILCLADRVNKNIPTNTNEYVLEYQFF